MAKRKNLTFYDHHSCLKHWKLNMGSLSLQDCDCAFQCKEISYDVRWNRIHQLYSRRGRADWEMFFNMPKFNLQKVTELPDYTIFDLLAELGGYLGLFSGTSALSIIELVALLLITIVVFFKKKNSQYQL